MSLKQSIADIFEQKRRFTDDWVHKGKVCEYAKSLGYSYENAGRRLRELTNEGYLERKVIKGKVWYRYLKKEGEPQELFSKQYL